jgi:hypothetical protein
MPEFYSKSYLFKAGNTYVLGANGTTGFTGPQFPTGATSLPAVTALMPRGASAFVHMGLYNGGQFITGVTLNPNTVYPFKPSILGIRSGNPDIIGFC